MTLRFSAKIPGPSVRMDGVAMKFNYREHFHAAPSTGYETLIYDCMRGDPTLFQRADNIEAGWRVVQPVLDAWADDRATDIPVYPAGSSGPAEAEALLDARRPQLASHHQCPSRAILMTRSPPSMSVSLVLADVDGTLVTPESADRARGGGRNALHTARHRLCDHQRPAAARHGDVDRAVGAADADGRIQWRDFRQARYDHHGGARLAADVARRAMEVILHHGMDVWVYSGKDWFVRDPNAPHVAREQWTVKFAPTVVENFERRARQRGEDRRRERRSRLVARCEKDAQAALGAEASAARSQPYYLDVTHPDANKGTVVTTLVKTPRRFRPARSRQSATCRTTC